MSHVVRDIKRFVKQNDISLTNLGFPFVLDGELYAHGLGFQTNMKLIKKYREGESEKIKLHIYDIATQVETAFRDRSNLITTLISMESIL